MKSIAKLFLALLFISVFQVSGISQVTTVHFDKPFYVAGEYIFYSFHNPSLPEDTLIARVQLESEAGVIDEYFV